MSDVLPMGAGRGFLYYQVAVSPTDDGEATLTAWWPETMCSVLPCPHRIERWSDGEWRVAGERGGHATSDKAAREFLLGVLEANEVRARRWRAGR